MKTGAFLLLIALSTSALAQDNTKCLQNVIDNGNKDEIALGTNAIASGTGAIAIGNGANAESMGQTGGGGNVAIGQNARAKNGSAATALGDSATSNGDNTTAMGSVASANGCGATSIGASSTAGYRGTATGNFAQATADGATANGNGARATGDNSTAMGSYSHATGENSTAVGSGARAPHNNSVALGAGTKTERTNEVNVGYRQIGGVQDGTWDMDAVNLRQMRAGDQWAIEQSNRYTDIRFDEINGRIDGLGAQMGAMTMMAGTPGTGGVAVGLGYSGSKAALAIGTTKQLSPRVSMSAGISFGGGNKPVIGVGFRFGGR